MLSVTDCNQQSVQGVLVHRISETPVSQVQEEKKSLNFQTAPCTIFLQKCMRQSYVVLPLL